LHLGREVMTSGRRLHVAIVAPSLGILGGQAVQADRALRGWRDDPDVEAWLVPINPIPPGPLALGVRIKYLRTILTQLTYWPLLLRQLRRADVVHVFSASYFSFLLAPLPAVLVAWLYRKPVLVNYRSGQAPGHLARSRVARWVLARTDLNVVPSSYLTGVFDRFGLQARVVPNIIDLREFAFRERGRVAPNLLSTRNLEPLYDVACTLRAFRLVQDRHPDATLTVIGSGPEEAALRQLSAELKLRGVRFLGRIPHHRIAACYHEADIYVQTPSVDNMPGSVLEAFASGLPVVSTQAGGVPAILTHERHGLLAKVGDHREVAAQLLRLIEEPGLAARLVGAARDSCKMYQWTEVRNAWVSIYRELAVSREDVLARASTAS
jgi:glycosyltransferase involved in cell wall biosynthesis